MRTLLKSIVLLFSLIILQSCENVVSYQTPTDILISQKEAKELKSVYQEFQYQYINKGLNDSFPKAVKDYTTFTIELEDLKNYIHYAENAAKHSGYKNLALQFVLGAKKDKVTGVPYSNPFYNIIGTASSDAMANKVLSVESDERHQVPNTESGDRVGCGGNGEDGEVGQVDEEGGE